VRAKLASLLLASLLAVALLPASGTVARATLTSVATDVAKGGWVPIGPDGGDMHFVFITSKHTIIASHGLGGAWRSTDMGAWWELVDDPDLVDVGFCSMDEAGGVLFAGGSGLGGLWVSQDDGISWDRLETGLEALDRTPSDYEVVSIVALSEDHVFCSVRVNPAAVALGRHVAPFEGIFELTRGPSGAWSVVEHEPPFPSDAGAVVMIDYDQDFQGSPTLFVSSSIHGLFTVSDLAGSWSWEQVLNKPTTRVFVDEANDIVYVGTIGDWFWRGVPGPSWSWDQIVPEGETDCAIACFIRTDPYDPDRLWWGTVASSRGSPWQPPPGSAGKSLRGVGKWDSVGKKWLSCFKAPGWGSIIAIDYHRPGEDPDDYRISTAHGFAAKYAYVPGGGETCVFKTEDGGRSWFRSYNGIYADTMNEVVYLEEGVLEGHLVAICVSGTQLSPDLGDSWLPDVEIKIFGASLSERAGYAWWAASPPSAISMSGVGNVELFMATGYPPTSFTGNGLYAVSLSGSYTRLTSEPVHKIVQVGWKLFLALESGGIRVYEADTGSTYLVSTGLPMSGIFELAYKAIGGLDWWFASTYDGTIPPDSDSYFYRGPGSLYRATGLIGSASAARWEQVYSSTAHRVVSISLSEDGELLGLLSDGRLLYTPDFTAEAISWQLISTGLEGMAKLFTDLEVDWASRLIFISTFGLGILVASLDDLLSSGAPARAFSELNPGLLTRNVRNILLVREEGGAYLFAGTEGYSVWRLELELPGVPTPRPSPGPTPSIPVELLVACAIAIVVVVAIAILLAKRRAA